MNVIIMAAGVGARLSAISRNRPKCMIQVGHETIIARLVRLLRERDIERIAVVVGYQADLVREELDDAVAVFENASYATTNSLASLWKARERLEGNAILMNADLYFEPELLDGLLSQTRPAVMLADSSRIETSDYRFGYDADRICRHGKGLTLAETDAEYVGMARIDRAFMPRFKDRLARCMAAGWTDCWWEEALYSFIPEGVPVYHHDVAGTFWTEVDCPRDFARLQDWLAADRPVLTA